MTEIDDLRNVGRSVRPASFWREMISEYEQGIEGAKPFCQRKGIALSTFQNKRRQLGSSYEQDSSPFIPVQVEGYEQGEGFSKKEAPPPFILHIGERMRLEIAQDFDASALKRLIPCL
jgi:hypothetical protein